jgi:hypothetical protein
VIISVTKIDLLCYGPSKYIFKTLRHLEMIFGDEHPEYTSPLEVDDHLELDMKTDLIVNGILRNHTSHDWLFAVGCISGMI